MRRLGAEALRRNADARAELGDVLSEFDGRSVNATAKLLNKRGIPTARGDKWTARSIIDVRARLVR